MRKIALPTLLACSVTGCVLQLPAPESSAPEPAHPAVQSYQQPAPAPTSPPQPQKNADWIEVGTAMQMTYEIKRNSFRFDKDVTGNNLAVLMGRQIDLKTQDVYFVQWTVRVKDCAKERGAIYAYDLDGKALWRNDFVFSGGTIAATIAEGICLIVADELATQPKQPAKTEKKPKGQSI